MPTPSSDLLPDVPKAYYTDRVAAEVVRSGRGVRMAVPEGQGVARGGDAPGEDAEGGDDHGDGKVGNSLSGGDA